MRRGRFRAIILLQFGLLAIDVTLNVLSELHGRSAVTLLLLFIVQDFCIVSSLLVMCLTIFNTYAFQAGLFREVMSRFKTPVAANLLYLALSLGLHVWSMETTEDEPSKQRQLSRQSSAVDVTLFTLQRFVGVWHYYFYKKTALRMADDRLYRPSEKRSSKEAPSALQPT
ncbi:transmembrane protein 138-like isoform X1 [Haemaphysalis longicornis]